MQTQSVPVCLWPCGTVFPSCITSCQLHQHTCWVDRCCVCPAWCHDRPTLHSFHTSPFSQPAQRIAEENRKVTCEHWLYTHVKTGSVLHNIRLGLCHLPGMRLSEARLQSSPISFPKVVQLGLSKPFLEAACINNFPCSHLNQFLFTSFFHCIRSIGYFHTRSRSRFHGHSIKSYIPGQIKWERGSPRSSHSSVSSQNRL